MKRQYACKNTDFDAFAAALVDLLNTIEKDFSVQNPIPTVSTAFVTVFDPAMPRPTPTPQAPGARQEFRMLNVDGTLEIDFQQVLTHAVKPLMRVDAATGKPPAQAQPPAPGPAAAPAPGQPQPASQPVGPTVLAPAHPNQSVPSVETSQSPSTLMQQIAQPVPSTEQSTAAGSTLPAGAPPP